MNKKILTIAITCFSCLLLITSFAVADITEWAGKPEGVTKEAAEAVEEVVEEAVEEAAGTVEEVAEEAVEEAAGTVK